MSGRNVHGLLGKSREMCGLWVWVVGEMMVRGCWANDSPFGVVGQMTIQGPCQTMFRGQCQPLHVWTECAQCSWLCGNGVTSRGSSVDANTMFQGQWGQIKGNVRAVGVGCWGNDSSFGVVGHSGEIKGNVWVLVVGEMMVRGCWAEKCAGCGCGLLGK